MAVLALMLSSVGLFAQTADAEYSAPRFRIAVNGGFGFRTGKLKSVGSPNVDKHNQKLMNGFFGNVEASWFTAYDLGFGMKYSLLNSNASDYLPLSIFGLSGDGDVTEHVMVSFIGPIVSARHHFDNYRWAFYTHFGMGYLGYSDHASVALTPIKITGGTFGLTAAIALDFRLKNNLYVGAGIDSVMGTLRSYNVTARGVTVHQELDKDSYENLGHMAFTIGLRYYIF